MGMSLFIANPDPIIAHITGCPIWFPKYEPMPAPATVNTLSIKFGNVDWEGIGLLSTGIDVPSITFIKVALIGVSLAKFKGIALTGVLRLFPELIIVCHCLCFLNELSFNS